MNQPRIKQIALVLLMSLMPLAYGVNAGEEVRHFKGEEAKSYEHALSLLSTYNKELQAILAKEDITSSDLGNVHKLTYTLENALQKMEAEIEITAEILEKLHKASEHNKVEKVKTYGAGYLEKSGKLYNSP